MNDQNLVIQKINKGTTMVIFNKNSYLKSFGALKRV